MTNRSFPANRLRVCIDRCEKHLGGRIYSRMSRTPLFFDNCCRLILCADRLFDECGYPQSFQDKRSFAGQAVQHAQYAPPRLLISESEVACQSGRIGTFDIIVYARRHAGWQGALFHSDGTLLAAFQSELELLVGLYREI